MIGGADDEEDGNGRDETFPRGFGVRGDEGALGALNRLEVEETWFTILVPLEARGAGIAMLAFGPNFLGVSDRAPEEVVREDEDEDGDEAGGV